MTYFGVRDSFLGFGSMSPRPSNLSFLRSKNVSKCGQKHGVYFVVFFVCTLMYVEVIVMVQYVVTQLDCSLGTISRCGVSISMVSGPLTWPKMTSKVVSKWCQNGVLVSKNVTCFSWHAFLTRKHVKIVLRIFVNSIFRVILGLFSLFLRGLRGPREHL